MPAVARMAPVVPQTRADSTSTRRRCTAATTTRSLSTNSSTCPTGPWDDCFVNTEPVALTFDGVDVETAIRTAPDWVVYDMPAHATCVEPQSGPPDAFNIRPNRLEPGETLATIWFEIGLVTKSVTMAG